MKITAKQYAACLYESVQGKKIGQIKDVIKKFLQVLIAHNNIAKADEVVEQFRKIWNKKESIAEAEIISTRKLDNKIVKLLNRYIVEFLGAKKVILENSVDKSVLGGVVIKYKDKIFDASLKTKLRELKEGLIKS